MAQDRDYCRTIVDMALDFWVPYSTQLFRSEVTLERVSTEHISSFTRRDVQPVIEITKQNCDELLLTGGLVSAQKLKLLLYKVLQKSVQIEEFLIRDISHIWGHP